MKTTLRIPTKEQYAYIEMEVDAPSLFDAYQLYKDATSYINNENPALDRKEFNSFIERQLREQPGNDIETYNKMSKEQQFAVQTIKNAIKRLKEKEHETNDN